MQTHEQLCALLATVLSAVLVLALAIRQASIMGFFTTSSFASFGAGPRTAASPRKGFVAPEGYEPGDKYAGMVNLSGTLCYMNSVLQAFASLPNLLAHLDKIISLAEAHDIPTPVTDALAEVLAELNTGHRSQPAALRPHALLAALTPLPAIRRLLAGREQQDAHELFVVLAEAVSDEATKVAAEVARSRGLGHVLDLEAYVANGGAGGAGSGIANGHADSNPLANGPTKPAAMRKNPALPTVSKAAKRPRAVSQPLEGLLARRRVCLRCGYNDVVRVDTLSGMELPVPRQGDVSLDACISDYLSPEKLDGVTCDMCTVRATYAHYEAKSVLASREPAPQSASGKKKRAQLVRLTARLKAMVDAGVPNTDIAGVKWDTQRTPSIRETAVTRAPRTLRLHFVRSEYTPYGQLLKKTARVAFPLMFDLGPHMARGVWESRPGGGVGGVGAALANGASSSSLFGAAGSTGSTGSSSRSTPGPGPDSTSNQGDLPRPPRALYRLQSAILHYGYAHSSGHFVAIRRKPHAQPGVPGKGWLRISDADVEEVGAEELVAARAAVVMLFYERFDVGGAGSEGGALGVQGVGEGARDSSGMSTGDSTPSRENGSHPGPLPNGVPWPLRASIGAGIAPHAEPAAADDRIDALD